MRTDTTHLFTRWIEAGLLPATPGEAADLAMLFTGPIGLLRILHLHAEATPAQRTTARQAILTHVEAFIRTVLRPSAQLGVPE